MYYCAIITEKIYLNNILHKKWYRMNVKRILITHTHKQVQTKFKQYNKFCVFVLISSYVCTCPDNYNTIFGNDNYNKLCLTNLT